MSKIITVTVADLVYKDLMELMQEKNITNKSEFTEECLRIGIQFFKNQNFKKEKEE